MGGPKIPVKYGRLDADRCPAEGNLPDAKPPFGTGHPTAASHLRAIFYRMGFDDREIVALSGAHTLGRAFKERGGVVENGYGAAGDRVHEAGVGRAPTARRASACRAASLGRRLARSTTYFQYLRRGPQPGLLAADGRRAP